MTLHMENTNDSTKKLVELINELSKVARYKFNIQKWLAFYTSITNYQKEKLRKQVLLQFHKKYNGINLTKEVTDLHLGNYKTLKRETEDTNKRKHTPCSRTGRTDLVELSTLPRAI